MSSEGKTLSLQHLSELDSFHCDWIGLICQRASSVGGVLLTVLLPILSVIFRCSTQSFQDLTEFVHLIGHDSFKIFAI